MDEFCHVDGILICLMFVAPADSEVVIAVAEAAVPPGVRPESITVMVSEPAPPRNVKINKPVSMATVSDAEQVLEVGVVNAWVAVETVSAANFYTFTFTSNFRWQGIQSGM